MKWKRVVVKRKNAFEEYLHRSGISMPALPPEDVKQARRRQRAYKAGRVTGREAQQIELARMNRAWRRGNIFAAFDATIFCNENSGLHLPYLALDFWAQQIASSLNARRSGARRGMLQKGWHISAVIRRYAESLRDFKRFETVKECREHREQIGKVRGLDIYEQARMLLEDTPAAGTRQTMARVYFKVKRRCARILINSTSADIPNASSPSSTSDMASGYSDYSNGNTPCGGI